MLKRKGQTVRDKFPCKVFKFGNRGGHTLGENAHLVQAHLLGSHQRRNDYTSLEIDRREAVRNKVNEVQLKFPQIHALTQRIEEVQAARLALSQEIQAEKTRLALVSLSNAPKLSDAGAISTQATPEDIRIHLERTLIKRARRGAVNKSKARQVDPALAKKRAELAAQSKQLSEDLRELKDRTPEYNREFDSFWVKDKKVFGLSTKDSLVKNEDWIQHRLEERNKVLRKDGKREEPPRSVIKLVAGTSDLVRSAAVDSANRCKKNGWGSNSDPKFKKFKAHYGKDAEYPAEGSLCSVESRTGFALTRDVLSGKSSKLRLELVSKKRKVHVYNVWLCVGRNEEGPLWAEFRNISFHLRKNLDGSYGDPFPMDDTSKILKASFHYRQVGTQEKWELHLTVESRLLIAPVLERLPKVAAIDSSFFLDLQTGVQRVGFLVDSEGDRKTLRLHFLPRMRERRLFDRESGEWFYKHPLSELAYKHPSKGVHSIPNGTGIFPADESYTEGKGCKHNRLKSSDGIKAVRDKARDSLKDELGAWLRGRKNLPSFLKDISRVLANIQSCATLSRLANTWSVNRFQGDDDIFDVVERWRQRDRHLHQFGTHLRERAYSFRLDTYRKWAKQLCNEYTEIRYRLPPKSTRANADHLSSVEKAKSSVAFSEFVGALQNAARSTGTRIVNMSDQAHHKNCNACGAALESSESHLVECPVCGVVDRGENTARNMLNSSQDIYLKENDELGDIYTLPLAGE